MALKHERTGGGGSPSNKKIKDKFGEVSICVKCSNNAEEDSESCLKWEHRVCARISKEEYKVINNLSNNTMFFCCVCRPKVILALKFFNEIEEKQKSMGERVKKLEEESKSLNTKILQLASQANTLDASSRQNECKDEPVIVQVESIARPLPPKPPPSMIYRKYNVVFYGIKESPADTSKSD